MTPFFDDRVAAWVADRIDGCDRGFGSCRAMGVEHKGSLVAGIVFHNWEPESQTIEISAASSVRSWFTRRVINAALIYAFDGLNCQMVISRQSVGNSPARRIWRALGASEFIIPRLRGRDESGSIMTLTDDAWKGSIFYKECRNG